MYIIKYMQIYLIILLIICIYYYNYNDEHFNINNMNICNECSYKNKIECEMCNNCVFCVESGTCVSGDVNGPYFDSCNNTYNNIINEPINSYFTYQEPNYRRYYGNNQGRRQSHHMQ